MCMFMCLAPINKHPSYASGFLTSIRINNLIHGRMIFLWLSNLKVGSVLGSAIDFLCDRGQVT